MFKRIGLWIKRRLKALTFQISKATTAVALVLGALVDVRRPDRLGVAAMVFVFGLPAGLMIFGSAFNIFIWMALVVGVLFAMNLHNAWEVASVLKAGGLDIEMTKQAISATETVTPTPTQIAILNERVVELNKNYLALNEKKTDYEGEVLLPVIPKNLLES